MSATLKPRAPLKVLVTGGSGFLGRALTSALVWRGDHVVVLDLGLPDASGRVDGAHYVEGDIRDGERLETVVGEHRIDAILHLAALVIPACRANPVLGAEVNVIGHINILEAALKAGISRVVYASSLAARPRAPLNSPANLYGVYKHCCEDIAKVYYLDHGLATIGLRPNVVYGPGRISGETAAITMAMKAAAHGEPFEIPFSGRMCFQHIDEVVEIFTRALDASPSGPIASDLTTEIASTGDVVEAIRTCVPEARVSVADSARAVPDQMDNAALSALLGQWPAVSLLEGTRRTIAAFRQEA